jgi:hypothetical protein
MTHRRYHVAVCYVPRDSLDDLLTFRALHRQWIRTTSLVIHRPRGRSPPELLSSLGSCSRSESRCVQRTRSRALSRTPSAPARASPKQHSQRRDAPQRCIHKRGAHSSRSEHPLLRFFSLPPYLRLRVPYSTRVDCAGDTPTSARTSPRARKVICGVGPSTGVR